MDKSNARETIVFLTVNKSELFKLLNRAQAIMETTTEDDKSKARPLAEMVLNTIEWQIPLERIKLNFGGKN